MAGQLSTAFRAFWSAMFSREKAERIAAALNDPKPEVAATPLPLPVPAAPLERPVLKPKPAQSEAVTLLATLQREARMVDFLMEDIGNYTDEQIGGAVREIHRETASVLKRIFAITPIVQDEEGASVTVPAGFNAARFRLTGRVAGQAPFQGTLAHHGWEVTRCELPEFVGDAQAATTIAPAEVEIR